MDVVAHDIIIRQQWVYDVDKKNVMWVKTGMMSQGEGDIM